MLSTRWRLYGCGCVHTKAKLVSKRPWTCRTWQRPSVSAANSFVPAHRAWWNERNIGHRCRQGQREECLPSCPKIQGVLGGRRTPNTLKITRSARLPQVPQVDAEVSVPQDSSLPPPLDMPYICIYMPIYIYIYICLPLLNILSCTGIRKQAERKHFSNRYRPSSG